MKRGTVSQRHRADCPRAGEGGWLPHRCRGPWEFKVDLRRGPHAARRQVTRGGFATKREAQLALARHLDHERAGIDVANPVTVGEYLNQWLAGKRSLRPSTLKSYREHVELYLRPSLGDLALRDLSADHVDRLLACLAAGTRARQLSPSTQRRVYATLRGALNAAVARRLLPFNPALNLELPREHRQGAVVWTPEQVGRFLQQTSKERVHALYHLAIVTGLRRGELTGLRWRDVDLDRGHLRVAQQIVQVGSALHVGPPKTRRGVRTVPLDGVTVAVLRDHRRRQQAERRSWGSAWVDSGLVFTREDGRPLSPEVISRRFKVAARRADVPVIRFHDLRHTSASLALAAGVAIKVVSDRLGHSTSGITADLYTHVTPAVAREAADAIARTFAAVQRPDVLQMFSDGRSGADSGVSAPPEA
jgi:integrase